MFRLKKELDTKPLFLARKFDPLFNSELINNLDQSMFGYFSPSKYFLFIYYIHGNRRVFGSGSGSFYFKIPIILKISLFERHIKINI